MMLLLLKARRQGRDGQLHGVRSTASVLSLYSLQDCAYILAQLSEHEVPSMPHS